MRQRILMTLAAVLLAAATAGAQATKISTSGTLPANCTVGNVYAKTGASAGLYVCLAANTWTGPLSTSTGTVTTTGSPANGDLVKFSGASTITTGALTGDVTTSGLSATIANDAVSYAKMQNVSAASRLLGRGDSGSGDPQELTLGSGLTNSGTAISATTNSLIRAFGITIGDGSTTITTGVKGFVMVPFAGTITKATLLSTDGSATSCSIVLDIWKDSYANYQPTIADTITASAKPTLSSATKAEDATLTGWTTSIAAGAIFGFNVDSVTACTRVTLILTVAGS